MEENGHTELREQPKVNLLTARIIRMWKNYDISHRMICLKLHFIRLYQENLGFRQVRDKSVTSRKHALSRTLKAYGISTPVKRISH